jgi:hypothetical protein
MEKCKRCSKVAKNPSEHGLCKSCEMWLVSHAKETQDGIQVCCSYCHVCMTRLEQAAEGAARYCPACQDYR